MFRNQEIFETFYKYYNEHISLSRNGTWDNYSINLGLIKYVISNNHVEIYVKKQTGFKNKIKDLYKFFTIYSEENKYALLGGEFYRYGLFPILSVYGACFGLYCIHGSLVHLHNDKNIILAGLDGVGKSTLANLICQDEGNFILADNIVLFDGKNALNLNLTMRLEKEVETNLKIIYQNSFIKEVVPLEVRKGLCHVDKIINLLRGNHSEIKIYENSIPDSQWIMFLERAPEIGQANSVISFWLYMYNLIFGGNTIQCAQINLSIPNGKLKEAKEYLVK